MHTAKIIQGIEDIITRSRGISIDESDSRMLDDVLSKLTAHFHCVQRRKPRQQPWPEDYLDLEREYCYGDLDRFHEHNSGHNRIAVMDRRNDFNRIWNATHVEEFHIKNRGRKE